MWRRGRGRGEEGGGVKNKRVILKLSKERKGGKKRGVKGYMKEGRVRNGKGKEGLAECD